MNQNLLEMRASHGVHGFLGLDGVLPTEIRNVAWKQIDKYDSAEFRNPAGFGYRTSDMHWYYITVTND